MDELTALTLAVGRIVRHVGQRDGALVEHGGIHADRAAGAVMVESVDIWGHRARVETALRDQGYRVQTVHLIGAGRGWQIQVRPGP